MENTSARNWSAQQLAIFDFFANGKGNLLVRARAGVGKTTTILEGISFAKEEKILCCAFAKRNQMDMQGKLRNPKAQAKTAHSLGFALIQYYGWKGVQPDDLVESDRIDAVGGKNLPREVGVLVRKLIGYAKNSRPFASTEALVELAEDWDLIPDDDMIDMGWTVGAIAGLARKAMTLAMTTRDAESRISFDDMIWLPVVNNWIRPWFNLVVVDEAQDFNATQLLIAQKSLKRGGRIVVVGDDRQAIYGFRGADSNALDRLKTELNAVEVGLTVTYRCPKKVVELAQKLVPDYCAADSAPEGVVDSIEMEKLFSEAKVQDFVLSRKNAPLTSICLRFLRQGIPARVEGKDIGKALAAVIKKMKARSVPELLTKLASWNKKQLARAKAQASSGDKKGAAKLEAKNRDINDQFETLAALAEGAANVEEVLGRCESLFGDTVDKAGNRNPKPAVICSSIHKAKGLETDRVFVLVDTLYPGNSGGEIEEANIHYVAITRARRHLTLVSGK